MTNFEWVGRTSKMRLASLLVAAASLILIGDNVSGEMSPNVPDRPPSNKDYIKEAKGFEVPLCPALSCIKPFLEDPTHSLPTIADHQRASVAISGTTKDDGHSEEQNLAVMTSIATGFRRRYAPVTSYVAGDNVVIGNAVYRALNDGTTGKTSAPPEHRPDAMLGGSARFNDGTVTWQWINDAAIDSKVGAYFETQVVEGAGAAWGAAFNYHILAKPREGMFLPGVEMDYANDSGVPCGVGVTDCTALRIGLGGSQITEGVQITGNEVGAGFSSLWALRINGDKVASQSAIEIDAAAPVGIGFGVSGLGGAEHADSSIKDASRSKAMLRDVGTHDVGLDLTHAHYERAQVAGKGFAILPDGQISGVRFRETLSTPASSSAPCRQGDFTDDANYHYVCIATDRWRRVALHDF